MKNMIALSVGVFKAEPGVAKANTWGSVITRKKHPGSSVFMLPICFPEGKTLEDKRKEAHRMLDACIDEFQKGYKNEKRTSK